MTNNINDDLRVQGSFSIRKRALYFLFFIFYFLPFITQAQINFKKDYFTVYDFKNDWLSYDYNYKDYVPFVAKQHASESALSVLIDIESNRKYALLIQVKKDNYLFLDASLNQRTKAEEWIVMNIDSLYQVYKKPQLLLTLYGTTGIDDKTVLIGHKKSQLNEKLITIADESFLSLRPRNPSPLSDFFTLLFLFIIIAIASLFGNFTRAFERFGNVIDLVTLDIKDEFLINRPLSRINLFFILFLALELTYLYFFVRSKSYDLFAVSNFVATEQTLVQNLWSFAKMIALVFGGLVLKYFVLYVFSSLYRLASIVNIHYFKIIQSSIVFFAIMVFGVSIASFYVTDWSPMIKNVIIYPSILFYCIRLLLLYFTIKSTIPTKNLYLISYLCIVELIPLIIGVRYAL
jgi:hypothetical protein